MEIKMSLTDDAREQYVKAIDAIWEGNMPGNSIENITLAVAQDMDVVLSEIANCSKAFAAIDITFSIFYTAPTSWGQLLVTAAQNAAYGSVDGWIKALSKNWRYKACVVSAARNHRSRIQMGLAGM